MNNDDTPSNNAVFPYGYFETFRASLLHDDNSGERRRVERRDGSTVIRVQRASENDNIFTTTTTTTTEDVAEATGNNRLPPPTVTTRHRLMHIVAAMPLSVGGSLVLFGLDQVKSLLLAQHHFNNRLENVVPNLRAILGDCDLRMSMDFADTEFNARQAATVLTQQVYNRPFPYETTAVLGAVRSAVSIPTAVLNGVNDIPQVSHTSTSTVLNQRGPFSSFGRVVPPASGDALAAIDYFSKIAGTTHLGIMYLNDEYGSSYRLELERAAFKLGIPTESVAISAAQTLTEELITSIDRAADFLARTGYRHFMGVIQNDALEYLFEIGVRWGIMGPGTFWLFGDGVNAGQIGSLTFPQDSPQAMAAQGHGVLAIGASRTSDRYRRFLQAFREQEENPQFFEYLTTVSPLGPSNVVRYNASFTTEMPTDFTELAYDAAMSLGVAGCQSNNTFFTGKELFQDFLQSNFSGASGEVLIDAPTGGRLHTTVTYVIHNILIDDEQGEPGTVGLKTVLAAEYGNQGTDGNGEILAGWVNPPGTQYNYSDFTTTPPPPLPPVQIQNILNPKSVWICNLLAGWVILSTIGCVAWTLYHRNSYVIRASQPSFLLVICVGELLIALSVTMLGANSPPFSEFWASFSCMPAIWSFALGFSLVFSALFAKTWRINKILGSATQFHRVKVSIKDAALPGCFMVLGGFLVMVLWQATDPLKYKLEFDKFGGSLDRFGRPLEVISTCSHEHGYGLYFAGALVLIMAITVIAANFQAYKARHYATEFSESVYIGWSMAISLQGIILAIPVFFLDSDPTSTYLSRSAVLLLLSASTLYLIFIPKVFHQIQYVKQQKAKAERLAHRKARLSTDVFSGYNSSQWTSDAPDLTTVVPNESVDETQDTELHGSLRIRPRHSEEDMQIFSSLHSSGRVFSSSRRLSMVLDDEDEFQSNHVGSDHLVVKDQNVPDGPDRAMKLPQSAQSTMVHPPDGVDNSGNQTTELWSQEFDMDSEMGGNENLHKENSEQVEEIAEVEPIPTTTKSIQKMGSFEASPAQPMQQVGGPEAMVSSEQLSRVPFTPSTSHSAGVAKQKWLMNQT